MATYGNMVEYTASEEWSQLMERLEFFFSENGIDNTPENAGRRKAILPRVIRSKNYGQVRNLLAPKKTTDASYLEIVGVLKNHFQPKLFEIVQRYKFYSCVRKTDETASDCYPRTVITVRL